MSANTMATKLRELLLIRKLLFQKISYRFMYTQSLNIDIYIRRNLDAFYRLFAYCMPGESALITHLLSFHLFSENFLLHPRTTAKSLYAQHVLVKFFYTHFSNILIAFAARTRPQSCLFLAPTAHNSLIYSIILFAYLVIPPFKH